MSRDDKKLPLSVSHPDLAAQAEGWDTTSLTAGSHKKMKWRCPNNHVWTAEVKGRANGSGCPYCSGRSVIIGVNDLLTLHPSVAMEAFGWDPSLVNPNSHKKAEFRCSLGHVVVQSIRRRVEATGCPVCQNDRVLIGYNDLATTHPEIAAQADGWDPTTVTAGTGKKLPWKCDKEHRWSTGITNRTRPNGTNCPYCSGRHAIRGVSDLATTHPEIAAQADGWDPTTVKAGTGNKKYKWKCNNGHFWLASPSTRTQGHGCPYCSNKKVLAGYNDLATTHPEIAAQADGWDPTTVTAGNDKKRSWRCTRGHSWDAQPYSRTGLNTGCPFCSGRQMIPGETDLATTHPELAAQAVGWDPTTVTAGSKKRVRWQCPAGHEYTASITNRTYSGSGCTICVNKEVLVGYNDLAATHPEIAAQADGWDPTTVTAGSGKKRKWLCEKGHNWVTPVAYRLETNCPICSNKKVLSGYNDLATTHPELAAQAVGWDPTTVTAGSNYKRKWRCEDGHIWQAPPMSRTAGRGCPSCAKYGFNPEKPGWLYFLEHPEWGLYQIGITNDTKRRIGKHQAAGWFLLDIRGPMDGSHTRLLEASIIQVVKKLGAEMANKIDIQKFDGYSEAWTTSSVSASSIKQLLDLVYEAEEVDQIGAAYNMPEKN